MTSCYTRNCDKPWLDTSACTFLQSCSWLKPKIACLRNGCSERDYHFKQLTHNASFFFQNDKLHYYVGTSLKYSLNFCSNSGSAKSSKINSTPLHSTTLINVMKNSRSQLVPWTDDIKRTTNNSKRINAPKKKTNEKLTQRDTENAKQRRKKNKSGWIYTKVTSHISRSKRREKHRMKNEST